MPDAARDVLLGEIQQLAAEIASRSQDARQQACELVTKLKAYILLVDAKVSDSSGPEPGRYARRRLIEAAEDCVKDHNGRMTFDELLDTLVKGNAPFLSSHNRAQRLRQMLNSNQERLIFDEANNLITLPPKHR